MSIDTPPSRPTYPDFAAPDAGHPSRALVKGPAGSQKGGVESAAGAADELLAPLDHFKDEVAGGLTTATRNIEAKAKRLPVLGQVAEFGTGAVSAVWGMAEGTYETLRHPVQTVQGLWAMASHVPVISPMWWANGFKQGFGQTLASDKVFWKAVGEGYIAPYAKDLKAGRYFAVAGRATVDVGTLFIGIKNGKAAIESRKASSAAGRVVEQVAKRRAAALDDGLRAAVMGSEPRLTGQVLGEGVAVVGWPEAVPTAMPSAAAKASLVAKRTRRVKFAGKLRDLKTREMVRLEFDKDTYRRLRLVGPNRMKTDKMVRLRFSALTESVDRRMDGELAKLLGITPKGTPKKIDRAAAKLVKLQEAQGPKVRLRSLDDLARGRIDLPDLDVSQMQGMLQKIRTHFGDQNLLIKDYTDAGSFYRGRLHVKIRDGSGMWYELQIGPRQLSKFYDTPFELGDKIANIHDAVYKGVFVLDDEAVKILGKGDRAVGQKRMAAVLNLYVDQLDDIIAMAKRGVDFDYALQTAPMRHALTELFQDLPPERLPLGVR